MRDTLEFIAAMMAIAVGIVALMTLLLTPAYYIEKAACMNLRELGQTAEWRFAGGCFVKTKDGFVTKSKWETNMQGIEVK